MSGPDDVLKLLILHEEARRERRLKLRRAFIRLVIPLSIVMLILIALSFLLWIQISLSTGRFHAFSTNWDCEMTDCRPSWVRYPCLNSTEGLNLLPTMYQKVKNHCYRFDGNDTVTYWLGHSPNYPENTLIMQKGRWWNNGDVDVFDGNYSSLSWIPITVVGRNHSDCPVAIDKHRKYVLNQKTPATPKRSRRDNGGELQHAQIEIGGKAVKLPLYPMAPDPRHIVSYYLPKVKDHLYSNKAVRDVAQSYLSRNIFVRDDPSSDTYKLVANDKFLRRWNVLQPEKVHLVRWDKNRSYGAVCDRLGRIDKTDKNNFDLNGSKNGLPNVNALSLAWPRYTKLDDPWKETMHVERCLGMEVKHWFVQTFPPHRPDKCAVIINKILGTPGAKVPMEICNASFVRPDYTWANFADVLFQYDVAMLMANPSVIQMEQLHDHLESRCNSPTSMVYNVTAWMQLNMFHLCLEMIASRKTTMRVPRSTEDFVWKNFQPHQVYMWPQVSDAAMGDEWFDREKQFRQFLRPIPSVQELRGLHDGWSLSHCLHHKAVHTIGPEWNPVEKCKKTDCSETEYCVTNMTTSTEYYPQVKSQQASKKYINDFLKQVKTNDVFAGYEYLNSVWLRSTGTPFLSDPQEPTALAIAWMFAFTVGAIFTDVTESVEEFVEEAWDDFVEASEDALIGIFHYGLYVFGGFVGIIVLCLVAWGLVRCCLSYVFKSACRTINPVEEDLRLRKLTNSLQQLMKDDVNALL
ncbi:uncharacterized protein LOC128000121 [Carassius gibelio]|uniref:uncharacterized protein LOC128000121 n=1 Tax=Carassius gibelio TaxID=101364 RepID=UPI002277EDF6|nr:uncharacterized protein LOC128000121 [Carassius gibelio]